MVKWLLKFFGRKFLLDKLNDGLIALDERTDLAALVASIRTWQGNIKRWYLAVDAILESALKAAEDGKIEDAELDRLTADGKAFVEDITK